MKTLAPDSIARWALIAGLSIFIVGWLVIPQYFIASDPWRYSHAAFDLTQGEAGASTIFRHRLGVTMPVALSYALLGVGIHSTNLWMLVCVLGVMTIVWFACVTPISRVVSVGLCLLSAPLWVAATSLYPDLVAAMFMAASVLLLTKRHELNWQPAFIAAVGVTCLFGAFLAKESAYWVLPLWLFAMVEDLRAKTGRQFWSGTIAIGAGVGVAYLLFCYLAWDDPLARFRTVQSWTGRHLWSWEGEKSSLLARVTVQPPWFYLQTYGVTFVLALLGMAFCPRALRYWAYYLGLTIGLFWIGSTSFTHYEPLPLMERMILPSLPAMLVLSATFVSSTFQHLPRLTLTALLAAGVVSLMLLHSTAIVFAAARAEQPHETRAAEFLKQQIAAARQERVLIVTSDERSPDSLRFFFEYTTPANLVMSKAVDFDRTLDLRNFAHVYVYVDPTRSKYLLESYGAPHADAQIAASHLPVAFESGPLHVYRVPAERISEFASMLEGIKDRQRRDH